jgi:hypothetical protein
VVMPPIASHPGRENGMNQKKVERPRQSLRKMGVASGHTAYSSDVMRMKLINGTRFYYRASWFSTTSAAVRFTRR